MKMKRFCRLIWIFFPYVAFHLCADVNGLQCLQCMSFKSEEDCYRGVSEAIECPKENHTYCITYSGYLKENGVHLIYRDCISLNLTSKCQSMMVPTPKGGPKQEFRYCAHSCDTDGCNRDLHTPNSVPSSMSGCCRGAHHVLLLTLLASLVLAFSLT